MGLAKPSACRLTAADSLLSEFPILILHYLYHLSIYKIVLSGQSPNTIKSKLIFPIKLRVEKCPDQTIVQYCFDSYKIRQENYNLFLDQSCD